MAAMLPISPLCSNKNRSCQYNHRFLLTFISTSIFLLLSFVFWSHLSLSRCPWHRISEKLTQFHRAHSNDSKFQYTDSTFVPRGRMRLLSFVGYSENQRNSYFISLKLSVGPKSSRESGISPSEASQVLKAYENKSGKTSVSGEVSYLSEILASVATLSALDFDRNVVPSYDAGSNRHYPVTSEDTPDNLENREWNTHSDSGTGNIRVGGVGRGRIKQFLDGDELLGLTRSTAYTENMEYFSIPSRSAWLKGDFSGGKPVRAQHRQLDKRWEEKLARYREESDDVDEIGESEETGISNGAGEKGINKNNEIDTNDTFNETVPLELPGELEEENSISNEKTVLIIENPEVSSDGFSISDEGGRGAVVDDEDYEDMDEEVKFSGNSVDESAATTDDVQCETCDVRSETTGVSEDFREAELAWQ